VAKVLCIYPRQSMWSVIAAMRSTDKPRQRKAKDAMKKARELAQCARFGVDEGRIIKDQGPLQDNFISLVDKLFSLSAQSTAKGVKTFRISTKFAGLARLRNVGVVIPTQRNFTVMLPPDGRTTKRHDGFAGEPALISHIVDDVTVMSSLQRPKKIAFMGSDGREYPFLLKPKDDLRKDARMMDLYSMLNRFLKADPESRRRNLVILCCYPYHRGVWTSRMGI
jgi:serine/threonine-protein kinase ATR